MKLSSFTTGIIAFVLFISANPVTAGEVSVSNDQLRLIGNLEIAEGKKLSDGVILITHGTLAHGGMEIIHFTQQLLKDKGFNTLAITLSLNVDNRRGMYDCQTPHRHRHDDAVDEIGAWLNWLESQDVKSVVLLGHSRGGAQTALFAAERDNAIVKSVVLMAPATGDNNSASEYQQRYQKPLESVLDKARSLVKQGKGDTLMEHTGILYCSDTQVTPKSFVSYYDNDPRRDTVYLLPKIKKPVLIVVAGDDEVVVGLAKKVEPLTDGKHIQMKVVEGADHFFRDLYNEDAVDHISAYLGSIL